MDEWLVGWMDGWTGVRKRVNEVTALKDSTGYMGLEASIHITLILIKPWLNQGTKCFNEYGTSY